MTLTHLNAHGEASMVDVSDKHETHREAEASGWISMQPQTLQLLRQGEMPKGDVLATARIAGIQAAKRTHELIPLCHVLMLSKVSVDFVFDERLPGIRVRSRCRLAGRTGVEMEALTAVSIACLTLYDMCKAVDRGMVIGQVQLETKTGGRSGEWQRTGARGIPAETGESIEEWADNESAELSSAGTNSVTVRFFAELRERLNVESLSVSLGDLSEHRLFSLKEAISCQIENAEALVQPRILCAVNHQMVQGDRPLAPGDEIAFFPPVTGG